jgi:hypothetical protein
MSSIDYTLFEHAGVSLETDTSNSLLTVLSSGIGQDSMTILYKIVMDKDFKKKYAPNKLLILFADTHSEAPETYDYLERVMKPFCIKHDLEFVHITNDMGYHGDTWKSLSTQWANGERRTIGSVAYPKTCTHNLKILPQHRYVEQWLLQFDGVEKNSRKAGYVQFAKLYGKIRWLIGFARGEERRIFDASKETALWKKQSIGVEYPLIEEGLNRQDCQDYITSIGQEIPFPSCCYKCPFASDIEIYWLEKAYPVLFDEWVIEEQAKLDDPLNQAAERNLGVCGKIHKEGERKGEAFTLLDTLALAKSKYPDITLDELSNYRYSHGHCVVSSY